MPTILYEQGFRFAFFSADRSEPPHVHVSKGDGRAKWWLDPIREEWSRRFNRADEARIGRIIHANQDHLLAEWRRVFGDAG